MVLFPNFPELEDHITPENVSQYLDAKPELEMELEKGQAIQDEIKDKEIKYREARHNSQKAIQKVTKEEKEKLEGKEYWRNRDLKKLDETADPATVDAKRRSLQKTIEEIKVDQEKCQEKLDRLEGEFQEMIGRHIREIIDLRKRADFRRSTELDFIRRKLKLIQDAMMSIDNSQQ